METVPAPDEGTCATCRAPLSGSGDCLACLLRVALYEAVEAIPPPAVVFGDFEIARREDGSLWELGRGGMGVTYRAVDRVLHRNVALKVIETPVGAGGTYAVRERFLREARAAAALKHPNVAGIFQFGALPDAERCYYAMELVEGETLAERIRRDGPLPVDAVLGIAIQVTGALVAAATRNLVHRDLKPGNIMLTTNHGFTVEAEVKVIDFGLAKVMAASADDTDLTEGGFVGTPAFASPEQLGRTEVDARSDLYALGLTMWHALTGHLPFGGKTLEELRLDRARAALPLEQLTTRKTPAPVVALLRSLLAVDPAQRPASAREVMGTLENCRRQFDARGPGHALLPGPHAPGATARLGIFVLGVALVAGLSGWWIFSRLATPRRADAPPSADLKSIAVLPFESNSADPENVFFTDGVHGEILDDLAKVADLKVISRTSVLPYKSGAGRNLRDIAHRLGVARVVEGSVQRVGNRVRVTAKLIDAQTDHVLWLSDNLDSDLSDVFTMQSEIAKAIVLQLQAKLSPGEKADIETPPTKNFPAYEVYLQGKKLGRDAEWTHEEVDMNQAVRQLEEATTRDPQFFLAWCELCRANLALYWYTKDHTVKRLARAERALQSARHLRPDAGEVHLAEGLYRYWGQRDFAGATTEFQTAERVLPNSSEAPYWLGVVLRRRGHWEESLRQIVRTTVLDPGNSRLWIFRSEISADMLRYAEAESSCVQAIEIDPQNQYYLFRRAACIRAARADLGPMRDWLRSVPADSEKWRDYAALTATYVGMESGDYPAAARALAGYRPPVMEDGGYVSPRSELEGSLAFLSGNLAEAHTAWLAARQSADENVKTRPQDAKALMVRARIDAALGDKEKAIRDGRQACTMLPVSADALDGPHILVEMAGIYAMTGEREQAIDTLRTVAGKAAGPSYGDLRLDHRWDFLRHDPAFEALPTSLRSKPND